MVNQIDNLNDGSAILIILKYYLNFLCFNVIKGSENEIILTNNLNFDKYFGLIQKYMTTYSKNEIYELIFNAIKNICGVIKLNDEYDFLEKIKSLKLNIDDLNLNLLFVLKYLFDFDYLHLFDKNKPKGNIKIDNSYQIDSVDNIMITSTIPKSWNSKTLNSSLSVSKSRSRSSSPLPTEEKKKKNFITTIKGVPIKTNIEFIFSTPNKINLNKTDKVNFIKHIKPTLPIIFSSFAVEIQKYRHKIPNLNLNSNPSATPSIKKKNSGYTSSNLQTENSEKSQHIVSKSHNKIPNIPTTNKFTSDNIIGWLLEKKIIKDSRMDLNQIVDKCTSGVFLADLINHLEGDVKFIYNLIRKIIK
jgi:hypothetical protein